MVLRQLFINEFGRVRSGWRFAIFLMLFLLSSIFFELTASLLLISVGIDPGQYRLIFLAVDGSILLLLALGLGWACGKYLEGIPFRALGSWFTAGWLKHLALGCVVGALSIGIAVLIAAVSGRLSFRLDDSSGSEAIAESLVFSLGVFAIRAAMEESLLRGYILQTLNRAGLGWLAIGSTALLFGLLHVKNPSANAISTANTMLAGIWFGVAYLKTRDLWFPFGIHLIWNWMQGSVFGIEVSGLTEISPAPVLTEIDRGPAWLTGEHYGIEASIACTIAILISIALIHFLPGIRPSEEMLAMTSHESSSI
jgi:membrane protease YdiL (CAAX protease family)